MSPAFRTPSARSYVQATFAWALLWLLLVPHPSPAAGSGSASGDASEAGLRATLDRHLAAINARDLAALLSTVTAGERLTTILPNGKVLATREEYRRLHVDWFGETDWRMVFDVQEVRVFGDTGIARVQYDSQSRDASGAYASRRKAILTLVFAREQDQWRLVYDQNTVVQGGAIQSAVIPPPSN